MITLVLGGARSGKSGFANRLANEMADKQNWPVTFIATAEAFDEGMQARINKHQQERTAFNWQVIEAPIDLTHALLSIPRNQVILIDCLTLWLNNLIYYEKITEIPYFLDLLEKRQNIILVSNELGQGVLPTDKASREFIDQAGLLNQKIATIADNVYFVTAGIAQQLK